MTTLSLERSYTPEDLLNGLEGRFELLDGQLVPKPMGAKASFIAFNLAYLFGHDNRIHKLGTLYGSDCGYQVFPGQPNRVRFPDASFVRRGRLPIRQIPDGHMRIVPDWALEVISPNDLAKEIELKIEEYLRVGIPLIWVVYPDTRTVYIYRADRSVARLTAADELSGEGIFPGFTCRVADLFAEAEAEAENHAES